MKRLAFLWAMFLLTHSGVAQSVRAQDDPFKIDIDEPVARPPQPGRPSAADDPLVRAVQPQPGASPAEILRSIRLLESIGRVDLSKKYLEGLTKRKFDDKTLLAMMDAEGSQSVMVLFGNEKLQPEGKTLAAQILAAADRRSQSPQYIQSLIARLKTARGAELQDVIRQLSPSGATAAPYLIKVLADPARAEMHDVVSYALTKLGDEMVHPLLATLESNDNALKARVVRVLQYSKRAETIGMLLGPWLSPKTDKTVRKQIGAALFHMLDNRPSEAEVRYMLHKYAHDYYIGERSVRPESDDKAVAWRWDTKSKLPVRVRLRPADVAMVIAARLARDLHEIAPDDKQYTRLFLAAAFEVDGRLARAGVGQAIVTEQATAEAIKQGPEVLSELLAWTMKSGHLYAARTTARLLGQHGKVDILRTADSRPAPLVRAVKHRDRRLRFAALEAIMRLKPQRAYPGSSYVAEALGFFVGSRGQSRALVLYADLNEAQRLSGFLSGAGFDARAATSPRQAFKILTSSPDYELVIMGMAFRQPQLTEFLQLLRREPRTGSLPIGLLVTQEDGDEGDRVARRDPLTHVIAMPSSSKQMRERIAIMLDQIDYDPVSSTERTNETSKSLDWITEITSRPQKLYRLRALDRQVAQAIFDPQLATKAMVTLSNLGTPAGQRALVNLASTDALNIKVRRAATASFEYSVKRFGLLLETKEILLQYQRYNKSEHKDADTQKVLAWVLNAIEGEPPAKEEDQQPDKPDHNVRAGN